MILRSDIEAAVGSGTSKEAVAGVVALLVDQGVIVADSDPSTDPVGTHRVATGGDGDEFVKVRPDYWVRLSDSPWLLCDAVPRWNDSELEGTVLRDTDGLSDFVDSDGDHWFRIGNGRYVVGASAADAQGRYDRSGRPGAGHTLPYVLGRYGIQDQSC